MAGYVATARIAQVHVRRVDPVARAIGAASLQEDAPSAAWGRDIGDRSSARTRLGERLVVLREQWEMTTFYLFDADSWR